MGGRSSKRTEGRRLSQPPGQVERDEGTENIAHSHTEVECNTSTRPVEEKQKGFGRSNFVMQHNERLTDQYHMDSKKLGQGTYGAVCSGVNVLTQQKRAIKTVSKSQVKNIDRLRREIEIMKELDHPNIVRLYETFEDHRNIYLILELCTGGELFDRIIQIGHFSEIYAAVLLKQILSAVHYLHSRYIMHRDLKPENFLFLNQEADSQLKLIDFGLSIRFKKLEFAKTKAGTPYYVSPQVLMGRYDHMCDLWSCGVIMYILLCGYPPFYGETDSEVLSKVRTGQYSFSGSGWKNISNNAKHLIQKLLHMNVNERLDAEGALKHTWLTSVKTAENVELPITFMNNLKTFRAQNKLKKAALTIIAQNLSENEIKNLKQVFLSMDTDHSGTLSVHEIKEGLQEFGWKEIPNNLVEIMRAVDSDGSGNIDYTEFLAATMDRRLYIKKDVCWAAFRVFDLDGNGKISLAELRQVLGAPDVQSTVGLGVQEVEELLNNADLNGDGEIDFEEFMCMMMEKEAPEK